MTLPANENGVFVCSLLKCRLSVSSCAARWHRSQRGRSLTTSGSTTPDSLEICKGCSVGAKHAGGTA